MFGVMYFFEPISAGDSPDGPIVHPVLGLLVYVFLTITLYDWLARQMQTPGKAAFAIGFAQFILVNVDYVLAGKRGLTTGAASTLLMVATWVCVAYVYSHFSSKRNMDIS